MGGKHHGIDESIFSTPDSAMELLWNSIRNGLSFNKYDNKTRFTAQVLSPAVPVSPSAYGVYISSPPSINKRFMFKARILGPDSPHLLLPNPCNLEYVENPSDAMEMISLHTTFVSELAGDNADWPAINDTVIVELYPGFTKNAYNLQHGSYVGMSDNATRASAGDAERAVYFGASADCSKMSDMIDEMLKTRLPEVLPTENPPPTSSVAEPIKKKKTVKRKKAIRKKKGAQTTANGFPLPSKCTILEAGGGEQKHTNVYDLLGPAGWQAYKTTLSQTEGKVDDLNQWGYVGQFQFGISAMVQGGAVDKDNAIKNIEASIKKAFPKFSDRWLANRANHCFEYQSAVSKGYTTNGKCAASGNKAKTKRSEKYGGRSTLSPLKECCGKHVAYAYSKVDTWSDTAVKAGVNSLDKFRANSLYQNEAMIGYTSANLATLKRMGVQLNLTNPGDVAGTLGAAHLVGPGGAAKMKKGVIVTDANKTDPRKYYNRQVEAANKLCPPESMVPHSDQYLSDLKANTPPEGSVADSYRLSLFDYDTYEV